MRRREIEFRGHEKFTILHAALLVFSLDAAGILLVQASEPGVRGVLSMLWIAFLFPAWYGGWLLALQRRSPYYRFFGMLLTAVNLVWSVWLLPGVGPDDDLRAGYLAVSAFCMSLGLGILRHAQGLRRSRVGRPAFRAAD
jgi:hypothetical protein